jgi:hypothetical protein
MNINLTGQSKFDLVVTSTLSTDLTIEIFNNDQSQFKTFNAAVQKQGQTPYYPVQLNPTPITLKVGTGANDYVYGFAVGLFDTFTNAAFPAVPTGAFNSKALCFFDQATGNAVYQPGFVAGSLDAGQVTIATKQTNYRHLFEVFGKLSILITAAKIRVNPAYQSQLSEDFSYIQSNIAAAASTVPFSPDTFSDESNLNPNLITYPVNKEINPKTGFTYTVQAQQNNVPNVINMQFFYQPNQPGALALK